MGCGASSSAQVVEPAKETDPSKQPPPAAAPAAQGARNSNRNKSHVLKQLQSYLPQFALSYVKENNGLPSEPVHIPIQGSILFIDISGFSKLTARIKMGRIVGAEQTAKHVSGYFTNLIAEINKYGGDVQKFAGDALIVLFAALPGAAEHVTLEQCTLRAAACGLAIQSSLGSYQVREDLTLTLHIAIASGHLQGHFVGGVNDNWEFLVSGDPLTTLSRTVDLAASGQMVCDLESFHYLGGKATAERLSSGDYVISDIPADLKRATKPVDPAVLPDSLEFALRSFVPKGVQQALEDRGKVLGEFRRVTTLFINLMGVRELPTDKVGETLHAALTEMQEVIDKRYGGVVRQFLVDDKGTVLIGCFGLPSYTHSNDPVRGIHAAIEITDRLKKLQIKSAIGVTSADFIYAGPVGSPERHEYAVVGDGVTLAARIMGAATAAGADIYVDDDCYNLATTAAEWGPDPPAVKVKARDDLVAVHVPVSKLEAQPNMSSETTVLRGRDAELAQLSTGLRAFAKSKTTTVIVCVGEPGIGKTAMAKHFRSLCLEEGFAVAVASGSAAEVHTPYYAWQAILKQEYGSSLEDGGANAREGHISRDALAHANTHDTSALSLLNPILDCKFGEVAGLADLGAREKKEALLRLLASCVTSIASRYTLAIILEDCHDLDPESWELIDRVKHQSKNIIMFCTLRPQYNPSPSFNVAYRDPDTILTSLHKLDDATVVAIARDMFQLDAISPAVGQVLSSKGQGNPFWARGLAEHLVKNDWVRFRNGVMEWQDGVNPDALSLPGDLNDLATADIDALRPSDQDTLKTASVLGTAFPANILDFLICAAKGKDSGTKVSATPVNEKLIAARKRIRNIIGTLGDYVKQPAEGSMVLEFRNSLVSDILYDRLLFEQRKMHHLHVVDYLGEDQGPLSDVAHHLGRAAVHEIDLKRRHELTKRAVAKFQEVARREASEEATSAALADYDRAIELYKTLFNDDHKLKPTNFDLQVQTEIHLARAQLLVETRGFGNPETKGAYISAFENASQLKDIKTIITVRFGLWNYYLTGGDFQNALETLTALDKDLKSGKGLSADLKSEALKERALAESSTYHAMGRYEEADEHMSKGLAVKTTCDLYLTGCDAVSRCQVEKAWRHVLRGKISEALAFLGVLSRSEFKDSPFSRAVIRTSVGLLLAWLKRTADVNALLSKDFCSMVKSRGYGVQLQTIAFLQAWLQVQSAQSDVDLEPSVLAMKQSLDAVQLKGVATVGEMVLILVDIYLEHRYAAQGQHLVMSWTHRLDLREEFHLMSELLTLHGRLVRFTREDDIRPKLVASADRTTVVDPKARDSYALKFFDRSLTIAASNSLPGSRLFATTALVDLFASPRVNRAAEALYLVKREEEMADTGSADASSRWVTEWKAVCQSIQALKASPATKIDPPLRNSIRDWDEEDPALFDILKRPLKLTNTVTLSGRLVMSAMTRGKCSDTMNGILDHPNLINHYEARAKGGFSLLHTDTMAIDGECGHVEPWGVGMWNDEQAAVWKPVIAAVHKHNNTKLFASVSHAGRYAPAKYNPGPAIAPSAVMSPSYVRGTNLPPTPAPVPLEMSKADIKRVRQLFIDAAVRGKNIAGFDGIELMAGHGHLLDQFLWHVSNRRKDEYGSQTPENRVRFLCEIVKGIKAACGEDFPVTVKLSNWKMEDFESIVWATESDLKEMIQLLDKAGINAFYASEHYWYKPYFGTLRPLGSVMKKYTNKPVFVNGSITNSRLLFDSFMGIPTTTTSPLPAVHNIEYGGADLIAMGRPAVANPDLGKKLESGKWRDLAKFSREMLANYD